MPEWLTWLWGMLTWELLYEIIKVIEEYQTLLAGMLAIGAALIAYNAATNAALIAYNAALQAALIAYSGAAKQASATERTSKNQIDHLVSEKEETLKRRKAAFSLAILRELVIYTSQIRILRNRILPILETSSSNNAHILDFLKSGKIDGLIELKEMTLSKSNWEDLALLDVKTQAELHALNALTPGTNNHIMQVKNRIAQLHEKAQKEYFNVANDHRMKQDSEVYKLYIEAKGEFDESVKNVVKEAFEGILELTKQINEVAEPLAERLLEELQRLFPTQKVDIKEGP